MFRESEENKSVERLIFIDNYTDVNSEVGQQPSRWKGFTFFKISGKADVMPNDNSLSGDRVALHTAASTGQASAGEADEFELIV